MGGRFGPGESTYRILGHTRENNSAALGTMRIVGGNGLITYVQMLDNALTFEEGLQQLHTILLREAGR